MSPLWQYIIAGAIVVAAAFGLWRSLSKPGSTDGCAGCALAQECKSKGKKGHHGHDFKKNRPNSCMNKK